MTASAASVLQAIAELKPSNHLCCIYETEAQHRSVMTAFLHQGLERDEKVLYIIDEHAAETILHYLKDDGLDVQFYLSHGQLKILTQDDTYVRDGVFDPDGMIALLASETQIALQEGYAALQVTGEMTCALRGLPGSERLIEYEIKLNTFFPGQRCMALCQYDRRRFAPEILLDVLRTHPIAVVGTEVYDNFYYTSPQEMLRDDPAQATLLHWVGNLSEHKQTEEKLAEYREHLEDLVEARTRELANVNQRLHEMHHELEVQTAELEVVNAELSQYAYVVSHDLRAPLRAIRNYADFIREDLQASDVGPSVLNEDVALYLDGLNKAVSEADALVQDLLALSRIGRKRRPAQSVDVGEFLRKLIAPLRVQDVEITMLDHWPIIEVEPTLLGQIFQNLIDNAIKFNHASPKRVDLGWRVFDEHKTKGLAKSSGLTRSSYEFFVRDNGIGIDPRYHEQIFQVFERLHTPDEYEGTGAGLAIVKKAVDQLGGTVRLESELGRGSTFYFTIPKTGR